MFPRRKQNVFFSVFQNVQFSKYREKYQNWWQNYPQRPATHIFFSLNTWAKFHEIKLNSFQEREECTPKFVQNTPKWLPSEENILQILFLIRWTSQWKNIEQLNFSQEKKQRNIPKMASRTPQITKLHNWL